MDAQDLIIGSKLTHLRELKSEIARLKTENEALKARNAALEAHFALALTASEELRALRDGEKMVIYDGWNLILGARRKAKDRRELIAQAEAALAERGGGAWIVFDGADERVICRGGLRVSYTGGEGLHRADRMICDYLRAAVYLGLGDRVEIVTMDKDFLKRVEKIRSVGR